MADHQKLRELSTRLVFAGLALILIVGSLGYLSQLAISQILTNVPETGIRIVTTVIIVIFSVLIVQIASKLLEWITGRSEGLTDHQQEVFYRFVQITVYVSSLLLIVSSVWEIDLSNVLLGAGVLGVLIGLSARQGLSAVIAGIIIMATNMFRVRDWVEFEDKFGRITKITFFNTHLKSPQGEYHIIPNDKITSERVTNVSRGKYRNDLLIGVDYDCDLEEVIGICDSAMGELANDDAVTVISGYHPTSVKEFDDSSIVLSIKVWLDRPSPRNLNQSQTLVFTRLHERFKEKDIDIPFPQMTISQREESKSSEFEEADETPSEE